MEILTQFGIGDKVFVLSQSKAAEIEIASIVIDRNGVRYSTCEGISLYPTYPESECFKTKEDLVQYVLS